MIKASEEQQYVKTLLEQGKNVVVVAVAGSGKTTTTLLCATEMKNTSFIHLTIILHFRQKIVIK